MSQSLSKKESEALRKELVALLANFEKELKSKDLRENILALVPALHLLRDLGSSLISREEASAARDRILLYFRKYPFKVIHGDELMIISGIQEWPRRVRELRVEFGWSIATGVTIKEMFSVENGEIEGLDSSNLKPNEYILLSEGQDMEAADRWRAANEIRKKRESVKNKILEFFRFNEGIPVTGEELRYVAGDKTEWARRVRELRTEEGWPVSTRNTGRPDLPVGSYMLEGDRQSPAHDRKIPDPVRRRVLVRDKYHCQDCNWNHEMWNPSDPRHLELHHIKPHVEGGENVEENLVTVCTSCHDERHRIGKKS